MGTKRISIWLILMSLAFAASQMHPGFSTMITCSMLLVLLLALRLVAHFEGQYMLKEAETRGKGVSGHLVRELLISSGIATVLIFIIFMVIKHVPWLWFPSSN